MFMINDSESIRLELVYDKDAKELQIMVTGKEKIEHVMIYGEDKKLLVEFDEEQIPPWSNTVSLRIPCPARCKFYFVIQTKDGSSYRIKGKETDLSKNGTFVEIGEPRD